MEAQAIRKRKTVLLSKEEFSAFKSYTSKFHTLVEAAEAIGIHRNVLDRVIIVKRGSSETIGKIRTAIGVVGDNDTTQNSELQQAS